MAARVFADFMNVALNGESNQPFPVPDGLTFVCVNRNSGIAAAQDPNGIIINEAFKPGQKPNPGKVLESDNPKPTLGGIF